MLLNRFYAGKIDNGFENIGKKRQVVTEHYLRDALESILLQKEIEIKETQPVGCFIIKTKTPKHETDFYKLRFFNHALVFFESPNRNLC